MPPCLNRFAISALTLAALLALNACKSSPKIKGVPSNLPDVNLDASARTPSHNMEHGDYPFDSSGNYVTAWAAQGGDPEAPPEARRSSSSSTRRSSGSSSSTARKSSYSPSGTKSKSTSTASKSKSKSSGSRKHTVKSGDSLWSIARKYGTSVAKIKSANGLKSDMIRDGRALTIPRS